MYVSTASRMVEQIDNLLSDDRCTKAHAFKLGRAHVACFIPNRQDEARALIDEVNEAIKQDEKS